MISRIGNTTTSVRRPQPASQAGSTGHLKKIGLTSYFNLRTVTATLAHLLDTFKNHDDPKQHAWWYYDAFLKVNNTDYKESPFMAQASAKALFRQ